MLEISVISLMYAIRDYLESMGRKQPALFLALLNQAIEAIEADRYTIENLKQEVKELQHICVERQATIEKLTTTVTDVDIAKFAQAWNSKSGSPLKYDEFWNNENDVTLTGIIRNAKGVYRIQAIKDLRALSGLALREAKEVIEAFI